MANIALGEFAAAVSNAGGLGLIGSGGYDAARIEQEIYEARQATANAIRFWLSERGAKGSYEFTNREKHPDAIRAKEGHKAVLTWADKLLQHARDDDEIEHSITLDPKKVELKKDASGDTFSGSTKITLKNIDCGYQLSGYPNGLTLSGHWQVKRLRFR